jgi:hypothetical protein
MNANTLFTERQRFNQGWLWLGLAAINTFFLYGLFTQTVQDVPFGDHPMSNTGLAFTAGGLLLITLLLLSVRIDTEIRQDGIYVRFFPFQLAFRKYAWELLKDAQVRQYKPLVEYGGWGIRFEFSGNGRGKALMVSGDMGLQLELTDGTRMLIGTQKPEELEAAVSAARNNKR